MMKRNAFMLTIALAGGTASAQTEELYIHGQGNARMDVVQGGGVVRAWNTRDTLSCPFVVSDGTVRMTSYSPGSVGNEYDYFGTPTGNTFTAPSPIGYDATTDGKSNYYTDFSGAVYRSNTDYTGGSFLFSVSMANPGGIAFDSSNGSLWVSEWSGTRINNYDMGGTLLGGFNLDNFSNMALAYEATSDTLWVFPRDLGQVQQWSKGGSKLNQFTPAGFDASNVLSAEFALVPAPGAMALLGLGGLAAARRRR